MEKVQVYYKISGDYCKFHEISGEVVYDITNNIQISEFYSLEECQTWDCDSPSDYADIKIVEAIKIGDDYYIAEDFRE